MWTLGGAFMGITLPFLPFLHIQLIHFIYQALRWCNRRGCCSWILRCSLTSQVIGVTFYIEREKSNKFCSEVLILDWGCFTCHKSKIWDQRLYFPSEGSHTQDFYALKNPPAPARFEPMNLRFIGEYDNHWTTGVNINEEIFDVKDHLMKCYWKCSFH